MMIELPGHIQDILRDVPKIEIEAALDDFIFCAVWPNRELKTVPYFISQTSIAHPSLTVSDVTPLFFFLHGRFGKRGSPGLADWQPVEKAMKELEDQGNVEPPWNQPSAFE